MTLSFSLAGCFSKQSSLSEHEWNLVHKAEDYFNQKSFESGDFIQKGNFRNGKGKFVFEPGHFCLKYQQPDPGILYLDSKRLIEENSKTAERTFFKIEGTPFSNFLDFPIKLTSRGAHLEQVTELQDGSYMIELSKMFHMKKCTVSLFFSNKGERVILSGMKATMAGYYLQVFFENIQQQKSQAKAVCLPPA
ncbi:hypothetical protein FAI40_00455 [Acetobacteraceae bacterium]|nr:hypothetical protein FAI40_00455 [Acetobacteraceae bacterium]